MAEAIMITYYLVSLDNYESIRPEELYLSLRRKTTLLHILWGMKPP